MEDFLTDDTKKRDEKRQLTLQAQRLYNHHEHEGTGTTLERSNCSACVLQGYSDRKNGKPYAPNYAGWARVYVQAGIQIPVRYMEAFKQELKSKNTLYAKALREDIETYGAKFWE